MMFKTVFDPDNMFFKLKNPLFATYFKFTYMGMIFCGMHPNQKGIYKEFSILFVKFALLFFMVIAIVTIREDINGSRDNLDAVRQLAMLCMLAIAYHKYISIVKHSADVSAILEYIDEDFENNRFRDLQSRIIVATYARTSKLIQNFWSVCVVGVLLAFPLLSVSTMIISLFKDNGFFKVMMCEFYMPFFDDIKYSSPYFEIIYLFTALCGGYACAIYVGYDCFNMAALIHLCGKLDVLATELRDLYPKTGPFDENMTCKKLRRSVMEHQLCYRFAEAIQVVTSNVHFSVFFLNSVEITFTGYQVMQGFMHGYIPVDFLVFFFSSYIHMFLPCYFCDQLTEKSLGVCLAAFESGWHLTSDQSGLRLRTKLRMLIMRAQKPILIRTGIGPVNLQMFSAVVRTSWSYFTLVRRAQQ